MSTPTIPAGNLYMNATLWTGTGSAQTITNGAPGASFQPDFVWFKNRSGTWNNSLVNSITGGTQSLVSNATDAQTTDNLITAFNSNGFTLGTSGNANNSGNSIVGWNWKAGGTAVSNTAGSITSSVSANTTSGFSIVTYTGNSSGATVGHGLGVTPSMIIIKNRSTTSNWRVWHKSFASTTQGYMSLNLTNAYTTDATIWNNTAPTSTVFSVGNDSSVNTSPNTYVAYCWSQIEGYSAFGTYVGNGAVDGPFIYTGFRPKFVMTKSIGSSVWVMLDSSRDPYNYDYHYLYADSASGEGASFEIADFLSNGFKIRSAWAQDNVNGTTYIYMAFAENPFKYANAR